MQNIYNTSRGNVVIDLSRKNLVVKMSGGYDSSVLLNVVAHSVQNLELQHSVKIIPVSVKKVGNKYGNNPKYDRRDPIPIVNGVIEYSRKLFPNVNILDLYVEECKNWYKNDIYYRNAQDAAIINATAHLDVKLSDITAFNGVTKNPPYPVATEKDLDWQVETHRSTDAKYGNVYENSVSVYIPNEITYQEPWRNEDKRIVFEMSDWLGIKKDMMLLSWSCEGERHHTNNFEHECMACWWCYERKWGYESTK